MDYIKAATDLALYTEAARDWAQRAQVSTGAARVEAVRKALVYARNADIIKQSAGDLLKAFPIKKRLKWKGMNVSIENPAGTVRKWKCDHTGQEGGTWMAYDYGYLRATEATDGDAVDVFMGPDPDNAQMVYVVRQMRAPDFRFYDEDKCMIGFSSGQAARQAYQCHYDRSGFLGTMDAFPVDAFLAAVKATKRAPGPVGGWLQLQVPQRMANHGLLTEAMQEAVAMVDPEMPPAPDALQQWKQLVDKRPEAPPEAEVLYDGEYPEALPSVY